MSFFEMDLILAVENHKTSTEISDLYDKIYVISLDRTPDRFAFVKKQFDRLNLKCERFSAVDGNLITVTDVETNQVIPWSVTYLKGYRHGAILKISQQAQYKDAEFFYKHDRYTSNPGEFGCAMSHRAVWADVVKHNYKKVIILEDDVALEDDFLQNFSQVMKNLPDDFDVFFLGITLLPSQYETYFKAPEFLLAKFKNTSSFCFAKIKPNVNVSGLYAYVITCDSAKKLLQKTEFMNIPIDNAVIFSGLKLYVSKIKLLSATLNNSVIRKDSEK
jgi:GR25 family glycosyltransferase involved in LPS biosynthesis